MVINFIYYNFYSIFIFYSLFLIFTALIGLTKKRTNLILFFISLELAILSITILFIFGSLLISNSYFGQIISLFILTLAACESSIGLALLITFFKLKSSVNIAKLNSLVG
jgi:NADH-quinone oxidoreductase subunit K